MNDANVEEVRKELIREPLVCPSGMLRWTILGPRVGVGAKA